MAEAPEVAYEHAPVQTIAGKYEYVHAADSEPDPGQMVASQYKYLFNADPENAALDSASTSRHFFELHVNEHEDDVVEDNPQHSTILGIQVRSFWIFVIIAAIIITAAIGGGIGGALAGRSKPSRAVSAANTELPPAIIASTTPLAAVYNYTPLPPSAVATINITCPAQLRSFDGGIYECLEESNGKWLGDIVAILAYTLEQCVDACSSYNRMQGKRKCAAVVLDRNMAQKYAENYGATCWLKSLADGVHGYANSTMARLVN